MTGPVPSPELSLAAFLRARRERLDPVALGFDSRRRRTPGLRREEVAQRAHVSATWYTWLEQGRGGAPSADVLNRLSRALMLTEAEREHLFMLGLGRPPEARYRAVDGVEPRLQRVLDAFSVSPALIKTAIWDIVAWNRAAAVLFTDYGAMEPRARNLLRLMFGPGGESRRFDGFDAIAGFVVAAFRADAARAGAGAEINGMIDELKQASPDFARLWADNSISAVHGALRRIRHPALGPIDFEGSIFAVDGRADLSMVVHNPVRPADAERIAAMLRSTPG